MVTWNVLPRNRDLTRADFLVTRWTELALVERTNIPDSWTLTGPVADLSLFADDMGCILTRDGELVTSGKVRGYEEWQNDDGTEQVRLTFRGDLGRLTRVALPDPSHQLTGAPTAFSRAYDTHTGPIEDLIIMYVEAALGVGTVPDRRLAGLYLPPSQGRGGTARVEARFDNLGTLVHDLAEAGGLRVRIVHDESTGTPRLALRIDEVRDVSADVQFGPAGSTATGIITSRRIARTAPDVTRAIALGGGDLAARVALQVVDTAAEDQWDDIVEDTVDQRQTTDPDALTQAAQRTIDSGSTPVSVEFTVTDGPDVQLRTHYGAGDRVGLRVPRLPVTADIVREVITTVTAPAEGDPTETVRIVVGTAGATALQTRTEQQLADARRRIVVLERSA